MTTVRLRLFLVLNEPARNSFRMSRPFGPATAFIACLGISITCAGCATDGLAPDFQTSSIGHQPGGGFLLSKWERNLTCERLGDAVRDRVARMAALAKQEKTARLGLPPTILSAISWSTGNAIADSRAMKRHRRLRAESDAYHAIMLAKNCPPIGLNSLYASVEMPQPVQAYDRPAAQAQQAFSDRDGQ